MHMSEKFKICEATLARESEVQKLLYNAIDKKVSFIFNAGAGAGKTYALIESLKYTVNNYGKRLLSNNQNILCITYTNVAVKEIKKRMGNSELVIASTIHEILWEIISPYKKELTEIHSKKLKKSIEKLSFDLFQNNNEDSDFRKFFLLDSDMKMEFKEIMIINKSLFYSVYNSSAILIKSTFKDKLKKFDILNNTNNFKKIVNSLYNIENFQETLREIEKPNSAHYKKFRYDARYNNDSLHKMRISHDSLLEYAFFLIEKYDILKKIIIDKYPVIFIDEYQDTHENVIKIMELLDSYGRLANIKPLIGYFGDTVQNIYDEGIGNKIWNIHNNLLSINKEFNRRSYTEIINKINLIRNDTIIQESIYSNATGGSVEFFVGNELNKDQFIEKCKNDWNISLENHLDCLLLTNKLVAEYNEFSNFYDYFSKTPYYKKNYKSLNTELLNEDTKKIGRVPLLFYKILDFRQIILNDSSSLTLIFKEKGMNLSIEDIKNTIILLRQINQNTFKEYIQNILSIYENGDNKNIKVLVENLLDIEELSYQGFLNYIKSELFEENTEKEDIEKILDFCWTEYYNWFDFLKRKVKKEVNYHTYHGTKGEEYENVLIIMTNNFGTQNPNKFSNYFKYIDGTISVPSDFENTKNLLYVACSRAIKNLRIYYMDDISSFKNGIEKIFGEVKIFDFLE